MTKRMVAILIAFLTLAGCQGLPFRNPTIDAERKLTATLQALPVPPGAKLLAQESVYSGGTMPQCAGQELQALYGTNQWPYTEILDYYSAALPPAGWIPTVEAEGREFRIGQEYSLSITNGFGGAMIARSTETAAKAEFKTVYLVWLSTPFRLPYPAECHP
jgi:hypothetical protein